MPQTRHPCRWCFPMLTPQQGCAPRIAHPPVSAAAAQRPAGFGLETSPTPTCAGSEGHHGRNWKKRKTSSSGPKAQRPHTEEETLGKRENECNPDWVWGSGRVGLGKDLTVSYK